MAAASTQAALNEMFKTIYKGRDLSNMSKRKTPLGKQIAVKDELYGDSLAYPIVWGLGWGVSTTMSATYPKAKATNFAKWTIPSASASKLYGRATIDIPSAMRSSRDIGAYMKLTNKEIAGIIDNMTMQRYGNQLWSDGAGDIGRVLAVTGSNPVTSFTLTNYEDAIKFDGSGRQVIVFNATRTGSVGTIKASTWQVDKVKRYDNGVTTVTVTRLTGSGAPVDPAANDYIYNEDTYDNGVKGIPAWIPLTSPGATAFYGVDRSREPEMLAGFRGTWEGTIADSAQKLCSVMQAYFDPQDATLWLSPNRWFQLQYELRGQNTFMLDDQASLSWGTEVMKLITPAGMVRVASDPYAPASAGYVLSKSQMEFLTTGKMIHAADEDMAALRLSDDDGLEYRFRSLALLRMDKPQTCGVFPINQS